MKIQATIKATVTRMKNRVAEWLLAEQMNEMSGMANEIDTLWDQVRELQERKIDYSELAVDIDYQELAGEVDASDVANYVDAADVAGEIDISDIVSNLDVCEIAKAINHRLVAQRVLQTIAETLQKELTV